MLLWSIGIVCARGMESLWIIFSILRLLVPYGMLFLVTLGFLGLCLDKWLTCLPIGGLVAVLRVLLCGRWCLLASCDDNGGKKMTEVSKMARQNIDP
jgi:hypothetical protein